MVLEAKLVGLKKIKNKFQPELCTSKMMFLFFTVKQTYINLDFFPLNEILAKSYPWIFFQTSGHRIIF